MLSSFLSIVPLFALISLGYLAKRTVLDVRLLPGLNQFVYYFAVPALMFTSTSEQAIEQLLYAPGLLAFSVGCFVTAGIGVMVSYWVFDCKRAESLIMRALNGTFANYAYMGIPIAFALLGEAAHAATIGIILAGNLLLVCGAQVLVEIARNQGSSWWHILQILDRSLLRNPLFMSIILGLLVAALNIPVPQVVDTTLNMLAPAAVPVALFCLGASLDINRSAMRYGEMAWVIVVKLLLHPALVWGAFIVLGVDNVHWLQATVLLCALPTGALAHMLAMRYGVFEKESSQIVVISTILSLGTILLWSELLSLSTGH